MIVRLMRSTWPPFRKAVPRDCFLIFMAPRVIGLGQPVLDAIGLTDHVEAHWPGIDCVAVPGLLGELDAIFGQYGVDLVGHGFEQALQELPSGLSIRRFHELGQNRKTVANLAVRSMSTQMPQASGEGLASVRFARLPIGFPRQPRLW